MPLPTELVGFDVTGTPEGEELKELRKLIEAWVSATRICLSTSDVSSARELLGVLDEIEKQISLFGFRTNPEAVQSLSTFETVSKAWRKSLKELIDKEKIVDNREKATARLNELWSLMQTNYKAQVNAEQVTEVTAAAKEMRQLAKDYLTPLELQVMEASFGLRDAANTFGGENSDIFLGWSDKMPAEKARIEARVLCDEDKLRLFRHASLRYEDAAGVEHKLDLNKIFEKIELYFNGPYSYDPSDPSKKHNYAANGNPDKKAQASGVPTIQQMIERDYPEILNYPDFIRQSIHNFIIVAEMRSKYYIWEYAGYKGSPIPGFDGGPSEAAAPVAAILYKAQSGGFLPKHRVIAALTRLPDPSDSGWSKYNPDGGPRTLSLVSNKPDYVGNYLTGAFGMPESTVGRNKEPTNVETYIKVRSRLIADMMTKNPGFVTLRPDFQIIPTFYDWIRGKWEGSSIPLGELTYHNFLKTEEALKAFEAYVDMDYRPPNSLESVDTVLGILVEKVRDFKLLLPDAGFLTYAPGEKNILLDLTQLMMIIYLKRVYSTFRQLKPVERRQRGVSRFLQKGALSTTLKEFAEICAPVILSQATLPDSVKDQGSFPLREVLGQLEHAGHIEVGMGKNWIGFFEDNSEVAEEKRYREDEKKQNPPFRTTYQNWMRDPTVTEAKSAH